MALTIDQEFKSLIPPLSSEELLQLEANIVKDGCRDPLVAWGGVIVDGHNRYEICTRLGLPFTVTEIKFSSRESAMDWMDANQLGRRNLTTDQRSIIRGRRYNRTKKAAHGRTDREFSESQNDTPKPDTASKLAEQHGVSRATVIRDGKKAETIEKLKETQPELAEAVVSGKKRFVEVERELKEQKRESRREDNRAKVKSAETPANIAETGARFSTIVIDPPWDWGDEGDKDQLGRARPDYATMSKSQLMELPLQSLSDDDCHLYLWITNRSLPKGFDLLDAWGFRYVTMLTWAKPSFGMGNYFRGQTEHILFGVKGSQPLKRKDAGTLFSAPRGKGGHSSKPTEFYDFVESCSPGPYIEMFSRCDRSDWKSWGENG